jgi:hypothetical protein
LAFAWKARDDANLRFSRVTEVMFSLDTGLPLLGERVAGLEL